MSTNEYIYGFHAVTARIRTSPKTVNCVYIQNNKKDNRGQKLISFLTSKKVNYRTATQDEIFSFVGDVVHQGVVAKITRPSSKSTGNFKQALLQFGENETILILDGIHDPVNLGACIRTADAAGVKHIFIPKDKSASVTPVVRKVAAGAAETVSIHTITNLVRMLEQLKQHGFWVLGLADEARESIYSYQFQQRTAIVMGNEAKGLRHLTRQYCDDLLSIPMCGQVESLNVSVATGIVLYEIYRQKNAQ